jgi:hypothetical protein
VAEVIKQVLAHRAPTRSNGAAPSPAACEPDLDRVTLALLSSASARSYELNL